MTQITEWLDPEDSFLDKTAAQIAMATDEVKIIKKDVVNKQTAKVEKKAAVFVSDLYYKQCKNYVLSNCKINSNLTYME